MLHNNNSNKDNDDPKRTHVAWAFQKRRRIPRGEYIHHLEVGEGWIEPDGTPVIVQDREPKGGYGSYDAVIKLLPRGVDPRVNTSPTRPEQSSKDSDQNLENSDVE